MKPVAVRTTCHVGHRGHSFKLLGCLVDTAVTCVDYMLLQWAAKSAVNPSM